MDYRIPVKPNTLLSEFPCCTEFHNQYYYKYIEKIFFLINVNLIMSFTSVEGKVAFVSGKFKI
jgi:hypothetical protein